MSFVVVVVVSVKLKKTLLIWSNETPYQKVSLQLIILFNMKSVFIILKQKCSSKEVSFYCFRLVN